MSSPTKSGVPAARRIPSSPHRLEPGEEHRHEWAKVDATIRGLLDHGQTLVIPGVPLYATGEEVVLFLHRTPIGYLRTNGYEQGRHRMRDRAETARLKARVRSRLR